MYLFMLSSIKLCHESLPFQKISTNCEFKQNLQLLQWKIEINFAIKKQNKKENIGDWARNLWN